MENLGPIQMVTFAFPGNRFRGEILPELDRLKTDRIVRVIDMLIVRKDSKGNAMVATASDLDFEEATALGSYFGALAGFRGRRPRGVREWRNRRRCRARRRARLRRGRHLPRHASAARAQVDGEASRRGRARERN